VGRGGHTIPTCGAQRSATAAGLIEPLIKLFAVDCNRDAAFALWTEHTTLWWPKSHKMTRDPGAAVVFEPRVGGRIYERAADGREVDWGEILLWEPPGRLAYWWHIGAGRHDATRVEVRFTALDADSTSVEILHSGWERLGEQGRNWRDRNSRGWAGVLAPFQEACRSRAYGPVVHADGGLRR
jgi:Activator of Hsp90 ATPase homolog 1-like protein